MAEKRFALLFDLHGVLANSSKIAHSYKQNHLDFMEKIGIARKISEYRYDEAFRKFTKDFNDNVFSTPIDEPFLSIMKNLQYQFEYDLLQDHKLVSKEGKSISFFQKQAILVGAKAKEKNYYLYPEVAKTILELSNKGFIIALITTANKEHAKAVLASTTISDYFDEIFGFDNIKAHKSAPEFYLRCCKKLCFRPENCIVIGNSKEEILVPKRIRMGAFFIDRERFIPQNIQALADGTFSDLSELKFSLFKLVK